jgi:hypothetical protein
VKAFNDGRDAFTYFSGGWSSWTTSITDLNGDGRSDVLLYNPANGVWVQALSLASGGFAYVAGFWGANAVPIVEGN